VRYTSSGSLDSSFGSGGIVNTSFAYGGTYWCALLQPDGRIVAAGEVYGNPSGGPDSFALARYNPNGSLDTSFGSGGELVTSPAGYPSTQIFAIALQTDGKIVVAGGMGTGTDGSEQFAVARYNANGALDTTFGAAGTGFVIVPGVPGGHEENATGVVIQADGKIVATGWAWLSSQAEWVTSRFNPDGSLDATFGSGGTVTTIIGGSSGENPGVALQSDGKIVVAGAPNFSVARYNTDGSLDTMYNGTGTITAQIGSSSSANALVIQPADGNIVLVGNATVGTAGEFALARVLAATPRIGSFTASANPVTSGSSETLTASAITDTNPGASITQVTFYYFDSTGTKQTLGTATQTSPGVWTLTFTVTLAPGSYTVYAQAQDNYNLFSDPLALTQTVQ
jgi:uncharacterized delta-60 repeat protein